MNDDARREFTSIASREPVPLARGALLIAKEEYPALDVDHYLDRITELAREAEPIVHAGSDTVEKIQLLSHFLFEQKGFQGNRDEYSDPRNSFLNDVLDRRKGIPITLSVIYLEVGRRLGLNLYGISFPTHFLVKAVDERGELMIDPFYDGAILTLEEIRARLAENLRPAGRVASGDAQAGRRARNAGPDAAQPERNLSRSVGLERAGCPRSIASCCSIRARSRSGGTRRPV